MRLSSRWLGRMAAGLFVLSVFLGGFFAAHAIELTEWWPHDLVEEGIQSARAIYKDIVPERTLVRKVDTQAGRFENPETLETGVLWAGGDGFFPDLCPQRGCVAVEFDKDGEVVHAYPYRLHELDGWERLAEGRRRTAPFRSPEISRAMHAVRKYSNGDLAVVYKYANTLPWYGGVARVNPMGEPVWVRDDLSHHWPTMFTAPDGSEMLLVPHLRADEEIRLPEFEYPSPGVHYNECDSYWPLTTDYIQVIDEDGQVVRTIGVTDALARSPFAFGMVHTLTGCDLLHLNYIDVLREDVSNMEGVSAGDYVVSLRNMSAFGIMDRETGEMKRMVQGTFKLQHSVQHLGGSQFVMVDNLGADAKAGPSRVLLVDLAGGAVRERTVFPTASTPSQYRFFTEIRGNLSVSQDRRRLIVASTNEGYALEIRISDGTILGVFRNQHEASLLTGEQGTVGEFLLYDLTYVDQEP